MNQENIPEIVSINLLCKFMGISRSRYYQLLNDGFILPPTYSIDTKRPFYKREVALQNISVIKNNQGINGKVCLFYNTSRRAGAIQSKPTKVKTQKRKTHSEIQHHQDLIDGLAWLGLIDVKASQVDAILKKIYPDGIQNADEGEVLKALYCAISEQNSNDNVNR
jgi:predicted DNA-binding transcriptional regulator AlpA